MKKLLVMVIALAVVFGMSAGVMAELDQDNVNVNLTIGPYAAVEFEEESINIDLDQPATDTEWEGDDFDAIGSVGFNVKTNTAVNIEITETFTQTLIDEVGEDNVWPTVANEWTANSYVWVFADNYDFTSGDKNYEQSFEENNNSWKINFDQNEATSEDYDLYVESKWNSENDWFELAADTYNGTVTATVSAQ